MVDRGIRRSMKKKKKKKKKKRRKKKMERVKEIEMGGLNIWLA
jgi:hypothetical protein